MEAQAAQESYYDENVDYERSPHLKHQSLRRHLGAAVRRSVRDLAACGLPLRVLEIGAGHGGYTEIALALGCEVTAVEMSRPALIELTRRFETNPNLTTVLDSTGDLSSVDSGYSMVLAVSVLHHIPDYVSFLDAVSNRVTPGGSLLVLQDPLWYPRVPPVQHRSERAAYLTWRLGQGNIGTGVASLSRRLRKAYDPEKPGDTVEYHVVRRGVDEDAVSATLGAHFEDVEIDRYWSTPMPLAQRVGERLGWENTFGVYASGRRA